MNPKMKISTNSNNHPNIDIIDINGELTGRGAVQLEDYLYTSMDAGRCCKIINLKHMRKADGLGLNVLENFINRGMRIMLINAGVEMRNLLKISGKEDSIKIYSCRDPDEAVLLFEKEILNKIDAFNKDIKRRCFQRVKTSLKTEFQSNSSYNEEFTYKAVIENLSEEGVLINQINALNKKTEESVNPFEMVNRELFDVQFYLNDDSRFIESNGECVWMANMNEERCAGIRFKNMKQIHNEMIRDYVKKTE
mgnify:CR=1 FL=1